MLQELLAEEASELLMSVLRLAMTSRAGPYWSACLNAVTGLAGVATEDEAAQARLARDLDAFATALYNDYPIPPSDEGMRALVDRVFAFVGHHRLIAAHPAYAQGDWLAKVIDSAVQHLAVSASGTANWTGTLDAYEGIHAIPLMTIHRSKGLEYHTVIFVALDDGAWWSFADDEIEATAGFFVAFTRAKQRVVFTYCAGRGARSKVAPLYRLLSGAGVRTLQPG
jgi:hypothetical protein